MSGLVNKVKEALHGDSHKHDNNVPEGSYGPHGSRIANAADPRVDSDLDNNGRYATGAHRQAGHGEVGSGTTNYAGTQGGLNQSSSAYGGDPQGGAGFNDTSYGSGRHTGEFGYETGATTAHHGAGSGVTGVTGTHGAPTGTYGSHSSRAANAADPRIDSDRDGRGAFGTGPGPAPNTAGPHKNDFMNKADPRVDSDMDGSRTVGGNKTYQ